MTVTNKYCINEFSPEELRNIYIDKYAEAFESTKEHAAEMFNAEYKTDHDFVTYKNVENAIDNMKILCGLGA